MSLPKTAAAREKSRKPSHLPAGEILKDIHEKQWVLGEPIVEKGAVGTFYSAKPLTNNTSSNYTHAIKIKPHDNGPLFVEMHFYMKCAKKIDVRKFMRGKNLARLGMPGYIGSGTHVHQDERYRFILMQKFAVQSVWSRFVENSRKMPPTTAYRITLQLLDVLEYIHSKGYVHGDIKGDNILLDVQGSDQAYLVDFSMSGKFADDDKFEENVRKLPSHNVYLSRDAHQFGEIEMLFYNLIHWLTGHLPWEHIEHHQAVWQSKEQHMNNKNFLSYFETKFPDSLTQLLKYVNEMSHYQRPDYTRIKQFLINCLEDAGGTDKGPLDFVTVRKQKAESSLEATPKKRCKCNNSDNDSSTSSQGTPATSKTPEMLRIEALIRVKKAKQMKVKCP